MSSQAGSKSVSSCVVVPSEGQAFTSLELPGNTKSAYDALCETIIDCGQLRPGNDRIPPDKKACPAESWRTTFFRIKISNPDKPDSRRRAFDRAAEKLENLGLIGLLMILCGWPDKPDNGRTNDCLAKTLLFGQLDTPLTGCPLVRCPSRQRGREG
jgi:hypothetical protein